MSAASAASPPRVKREDVLRFRLARHRLADDRRRITPARAAACPASDFNRMAALLALSARAEGVTRVRFNRDVDSGELVLALVMRAAIHALDPDDFALLGRSLIATEGPWLLAQLGTQMKRLLQGSATTPNGALEEVAEATADALANGRKLTKNELHDALRERVRDELRWRALASPSPTARSRGSGG